jgi:putative ABC transport system ATP-binding protein/lipoprotein-releasing system ATP-binding protein
MLAIEGLGFRYGLKSPVFERVDAQFSRGSMTGIAGPSGAGKSTLLFILGLLLSPSSGRVVLDGVDAGFLPDSHRSWIRARRMGFVFQDAALDSTRTVLDNVIEGALYGGIDKGFARGRAMELLDRFGVSLRADHRPVEISGGQAQRVGLCRALLVSPEILLADEPTGNLDRASADVVLAALRSHAEAGGVVITATHDGGVLDHCDQMVSL